MKIAINGFGRIGRAFFRQAIKEPDIEIVAINDLADFQNLVYLLKHDTVYGPFDQPIKVQTNLQVSQQINARGILSVNNQDIWFFQEKDPLNLPWKALNIDAVIEATGVFDDYEKAKSHLQAGAKKVIITAPAKGEEEGIKGRTILLGINEEENKNFEIISNGSCTTNAISPVLEILNEKIGIQKAILNTTHAYTATQALVDSPCSKDWLRGKAGAQNLVPSTTGAAQTIAKVIKTLENKFDGLAIRVPVICGSLADITFVSAKPTTKEEINELLTQASQEERWKKRQEAR